VDEGQHTMSSSQEAPTAGGGADAGGQSTLGKAARLAADYLGTGSSDSKGEDREESSTAGKLAHMAADYLGSGSSEGPKAGQAAGASSGMLSRMAADYLGVDSFTLDSVKQWWAWDLCS
jgi:hypothetical protein